MLSITNTKMENIFEDFKNLMILRIDERPKEKITSTWITHEDDKELWNQKLEDENFLNFIKGLVQEYVEKRFVKDMEEGTEDVYEIPINTNNSPRVFEQYLNWKYQKTDLKN